MPPSDPQRQRPPIDAYKLMICEQPQHAKAIGGKEKDRKTVDPPPILQLEINDPQDRTRYYLSSPYYFVLATLWDPVKDERVTGDQMFGQSASSLHKLKTNQDMGAYFIFGDLSVRVEGEFQLMFTLHEMLAGQCQNITSVKSNTFRVHSHKTWPGLLQTTWMARCFSDQGVRLRVRKDTAGNRQRKRNASQHTPTSSIEHGRVAGSRYDLHTAGPVTTESPYSSSTSFALHSGTQSPYKRPKLEGYPVYDGPYVATEGYSMSTHEPSFHGDAESSMLAAPSMASRPSYNFPTDQNPANLMASRGQLPSFSGTTSQTAYAAYRPTYPSTNLENLAPTEQPGYEYGYRPC